MIYKNIRISNFRGIKKSEIKDLNQINIFVGKNNSCKTSFLEAIFLLTGISNPQLSIRIDNYRNLIHNEENDFRFIFYNLKYQNIPTIDTDLFLDGTSRKLIIRPSSTYSRSDNEIERSLTNFDFESDSASSSSFESINSLTFEAEIKRKNNPKKSIKSSISIERGQLNKAEFIIKQSKDYKENLLGIFLNDRLSTVGTFKRIENLIVQKKKEFLIENLKLIDESITDIVTGSNNLIYFDVGADRLLPSNILGDGINKILSVIASMNDLKNGVLLIDEIDNGLHFTALNVMWKLVFEMCIENNNQLFITTHSNETLESLINFIESNDDMSEKYRDILNCYSLYKAPGNEIKALIYNFEELSFSINNNIEIRGKY